MKITVVGCGKIGTTVVQSLTREGHDVIVIDSDPSVIDEITNIYDVIGVCGSCVDCDTLSEAGADRCDLIVAATGSDELNMLCCFIAGRMGTKHTIARVSNPEYQDKNFGFMQKQLGLSLIVNPEFLAAREIFNVLRVPSAAKIEKFSERSFELVELRVKDESVLDGKSLTELRRRYRANFLICVVRRGDEVYIPGGNFVLKSGDKIAVSADPTEMQKFFGMIGYAQKQAKNVMIVGAGKISYYLSKMLLASGSSVKIIENDREVCHTFCDKLPEVTMINGDGAKQEILTEEGISSADAFVALTGMDEENILVSFFASTLSVPKVVSKVNREEYSLVAEKLGLDCIVSPKKAMSDIIVRYARALQNSEGSNVETLYKIMDEKAEALEFFVKNDLPFTGRPLSEVHLKSRILIAGIIRQRKTIIPSGDDAILPGDKVVVISSGRMLDDLSDIVE